MQSPYSYGLEEAQKSTRSRLREAESVDALEAPGPRGADAALPLLLGRKEDVLLFFYYYHYVLDVQNI